MRKIMSIALSIVMGLAVFSGCGAGQDAGVSQLSTGQNSSNSATVKTGGSTSVEKLMNALIYQFQDINREVTVNYEMNGSGDGIKNTISGLYEIGHVSRELKTDGTEAGLTAIPYAIDGIAVVVHKENTVGNLTPEQLRGIYTGEITNWNEVGGSDAWITVVTREASSGTRSAFAEITGLEKPGQPETNILASATTCNTTGAVQTTVVQNQNAIGYMSFSDVNDQKVDTVRYDGVAIRADTLMNGDYKLKRAFYLVVKEGQTLPPAAQAFVDFVLSAQGQQLVQSNNLLPVQ